MDMENYAPMQEKWFHDGMSDTLLAIVFTSLPQCHFRRQSSSHRASLQISRAF